MFSPKTTQSSMLTDKLKEGLMRSHNLLAFCENYGDYVAESKNSYEKFLISLCNAHLDFTNIPPITHEQYTKDITHFIPIISKDKLLLARLQALCKAEIEKELHNHEDSLKREKVIKNIGILIDFHHKLCQAINTPQAKMDSKSIYETMNIWLTEQKQINEESKQLNLKEQKHPKMSALKTATHVLGVSGLFRATNDELFVLGCFSSPSFMRNEFLQFLTYFTKQSNYQYLEDNEKEKLKSFTEGLSIPRDLTSQDIINLLDKNKSLTMPSGWKSKEGSHCVGFYTFSEGDSLKLVCCNRGEGIKFINDEKGNPYFSGNIILSITNNDQAKEAISKLFAKNSPFSTYKFENAEKFYKELDKFLKHYHFTVIEYQRLKPLKRNNCTVGDQKSLLRSILSNKSYKLITEEWRKKEVAYLLAEVKKCISTKAPLQKCFELQILYNYLLKTESAFARNKIPKQKLLSLVNTELVEIYKTINPEIQNENYTILKSVLKRFENDKIMGIERYKFYHAFKKQEELNSQWYQLQKKCKEAKLTIPPLLNKAHSAFSIAQNIETAETLKETLLKAKNTIQHAPILELLSSMYDIVDKSQISAICFEKPSSNDDPFNDKASSKNFKSNS
jgi:hypothetical protein